MPLYGCERCGFTSAAFRLDAAAAHRLEYPECAGVIRIIFRSADRHRGQTYTAASTAPAPASDSQAGRMSTAQSRRELVIRECFDAGNMLRLTLLGDLDVAGAETLNTRLAELKTARRPVRLDLSRLAIHRQLRNPNANRHAHQCPVDRMAARNHSRGQPHRASSSRDHWDRSNPVASGPTSGAKQRAYSRTANARMTPAGRTSLLAHGRV